MDTAIFNDSLLSIYIGILLTVKMAQPRYMWTSGKREFCYIPSKISS